MKFTATRLGILIEPEGVPEELYLESLVAGGATISRRKVEGKQGWGCLFVSPPPLPKEEEAPKEVPE